MPFIPLIARSANRRISRMNFFPKANRPGVCDFCPVFAGPFESARGTRDGISYATVCIGSQRARDNLADIRRVVAYPNTPPHTSISRVRRSRPRYRSPYRLDRPTCPVKRFYPRCWPALLGLLTSCPISEHAILIARTPAVVVVVVVLRQ